MKSEKLYCKQMDIHTYGRTFETNFIKLTMSKSRPKSQENSKQTGLSKEASKSSDIMTVQRRTPWLVERSHVTTPTKRWSVHVNVNVNVNRGFI